MRQWRIIHLIFYVLVMSGEMLGAQTWHMPSNLDAPKHLYLFYEAERGNSAFLLGILKVVALHNQETPLANQLRVTLIAEDYPDIRESIKNLVVQNQPIFKSVRVQYLTSPLGNAWPQDVGKFITLNGTPAFLDVNYSGQWAQGFISHLKSQGVNVITLPGKNSTSEPNRSNEGGNIDSLPTGDICFGGCTMTAALRQNLEGMFPNRTLSVRTDQLTVGHFDEVYSIIPVDPAMAASGGCNYAILKADVLDGIRSLLTKNLFDPKIEGPTQATFQSALNWLDKGLHPQNLDRLTTATKIPAFQKVAGVVPFEQWYLAKSILLQRDIDRGADAMRSRIAQRNPVCANLAVISAPVILSGDQ